MSWCKKLCIKILTGFGILCLFLVAMSLWKVKSVWEELGRVEAWEAPQAWHPAACKVVSAGVACVEEATKSTCGGYGSKGSSHHIVDGSSVFHYRDIAVCPGTYWCAKEGEQCTCGGEVAYATELFDGIQYTEVDPEFRWNASGTLTCGTDQNGEPFKRDPAPSRVKHCWCTPQVVLDKLHRAGGAASIRASRDACAKTVDAEYMAALDVPPQSEASQVKQQRRLAGDVDRNSSEPQGYDIGMGDGRELRATSSSRRRRTFSYTSWALVEVPSGSDVDSSEKHSSDASDFVCAYEFGAPYASYKDFETDGPESSFFGLPVAADSTQAMTENWAAGATTDCFVRAPSNPDAPTCAVAMEPPSNLGTRRSNELMTMKVLGGLCVAGGLLSIVGLFLLVRSAQQSSGYQTLKDTYLDAYRSN